ncbi:hypothetical protein ACFLSY_03935 [Bacteroidota bacterium]
MRNLLLYLILFIFPGTIFSQSLFEKAVNAPDSTKSKNYQINGYIRGVYYTGGDLNKDDIETNSAYGELDLKLRAKKSNWGDAYTNFRYRYGWEYNNDISDFIMREAYVKIMLGKFEYLIGKKIMSWGRADGFNPTDNLTPKNFIVRSPDDDDRRLGNFIFQTKYGISDYKLEFNWVPVYRASVMPYDLVELPENVSLEEATYPNSNLKNSAWAARINIEKSKFDGSVSYFEGYDPNPGINLLDIQYSPESMLIKVNPEAYRMRIFGADFSTAINALGIRGEFAWRNPLGNYENNLYIPNPDLQYVIGIDRGFGKFSILLQYIGRHVLNFNNDVDPQLIIQNEISAINKKFNYQLHKFSHSVSLRPSLNLLHETLNIDAFVLYNYSTKELLIRPKLTYEVGDAVKLSFGIEHYYGGNNTLFKMLGDNLNGFFFELRAAF